MQEPCLSIRLGDVLVSAPRPFSKSLGCFTSFLPPWAVLSKDASKALEALTMP